MNTFIGRHLYPDSVRWLRSEVVIPLVVSAVIIGLLVLVSNTGV